MHFEEKTTLIHLFTIGDVCMESVYTVRIAGYELSLYSTESLEYTNKVASDVDAKVREVMAENPTFSLTQATMLAAMDLSDQVSKLQQSADNMRSQLKEYLDDTTKAIAERDEARRMAENLKNEIISIKNLNG